MPVFAGPLGEGVLIPPVCGKCKSAGGSENAALDAIKHMNISSSVMNEKAASSSHTHIDDRLTELAETFRLLGDVNRLRIVLACLEAPRPVGAIADGLGLSPSLVSHHLRLLRAARVLRGERRGKQVYYKAVDAHIHRTIKDMFAHVSEPKTSAEDPS